MFIDRMKLIADLFELKTNRLCLCFCVIILNTNDIPSWINTARNFFFGRIDGTTRNFWNASDSFHISWLVFLQVSEYISVECQHDFSRLTGRVMNGLFASVYLQGFKSGPVDSGSDGVMERESSAQWRNSIASSKGRCSLFETNKKEERKQNRQRE